MNYIEPRQRATDQCWDWTTMNDGVVWASGACRAEGPCTHQTAAAARTHQTNWMRKRLLAGLKELRPASQPGDMVRGCSAEACPAVATHALDAGGWDSYPVCRPHADDLSWYEASNRIQS